MAAGTHHLSDIDLLKPVLTADDDVRGEFTPWQPYACVMAMFFGDIYITGGAVGGTLMLAWNWKRLGRGREAVFTALIAMLLLFTVQSTLLYLALNDHPWWTEHRRGVELVLQGLQVAVGLLLAWGQSRRFKIVQGAGHDSTNAFVPGLVAIVAGGAFAYVAVYGVALVLTLLGVNG